MYVCMTRRTGRRRKKDVVENSTIRKWIMRKEAKMKRKKELEIKELNEKKK